MPLYFEKLDGMTAVADTFAAFFANQPNCFWLDRAHHPTSRYSVIGTGVAFTETLDDVSQLRAVLGECEPNSELPFGFRPGLVGVIGYPNRAGQIKVDLIKVDRAMVFDHDNRCMYFLGIFDNQESFDFWYHAALLRLALIGGDSKSYRQEFSAAVCSELSAEHDTEAYLAAIRFAQQQIQDGQVYQLCLTTRLRGQFTGDPLSYFLRLRERHAAPYATFLKTSNASYASISPERLLTVEGNIALSTPIKGTRPRNADPELDQQLKAELISDPKERAENMMIVDLIRNDLTKVCAPESVKVEKLLEVVSYSTVHQLISEVSGELLPSNDALDALAAIFPGGSMTGAPKQAAIELIQKLERSERAGYSGAIGYLAADGACDLGMVIRTTIFQGQEVTIGVGGGIMLDSVPEIEHQEIKLKANALVETLSGNVRW